MKITNATNSRQGGFARFMTNTDGQVSLLMATLFSTSLLCGTVIVDLTSTFSTKMKMQEALDEAVKAAAMAGDRDFAVSGENVYTVMLDEQKLGSKSVSFERLESGDANELVGTASGELPLMLSGLFKNSSYNITVQSRVNVDPIIEIRDFPLTAQNSQ